MGKTKRNRPFCSLLSGGQNNTILREGNSQLLSKRKCIYHVSQRSYFWFILLIYLYHVQKNICTRILITSWFVEQKFGITLKTTELYTLKWWILWYMNFTSFKFQIRHHCSRGLLICLVGKAPSILQYRRSFKNAFNLYKVQRKRILRSTWNNIKWPEPKK